MPKKNPSIGFSILIALLGFGLFGVLLAILAPQGQVESLDEKRAKERWEIRKTVDEEQQRLTTEYGWIDETLGRAHVPTHVVMGTVIEKLRSKPIRASEMAVDPAAALVDGALSDGGPVSPPSDAVQPDSASQGATDQTSATTEDSGTSSDGNDGGVTPSDQ
ncbi:MAG: hypothetical protein SNJ52_05275 [Verrucomicrobiia bacterium]